MDGTGNLDMKRDLVSQAVYPAGRDKQLRFKIIRFFDRKEWALGLTLALSGGCHIRGGIRGVPFEVGYSLIPFFRGRFDRGEETFAVHDWAVRTRSWNV